MRPSPPTSRVLVTGATGFIGREVVRRLLAAGRPVLALARDRQGQPAGDRLAAALGFVPDGRGIEVIEGDLTRPGCGLGRAEWRRLRDTVETMIHCAGETTFFPKDMASFRAGHIDGPLALMQGLRGGRLGRWAHLSTAYVCGRRSGTVLEREGELGQDFHNPYERLKLESEATVRKAGAALGVDVRVFRPSIVVGAAPPTAGGSPSNLFFDFIRVVAGLAQISDGCEVPLRIPAAPGARFNIVPVEDVAAVVVALAEPADGAGETCHIVVSDAPTQEAMLGMITERLGVRGLRLVDTHCAPLTDPSPLERKVERMLSGYRQYLEQEVQFDDGTTRRLLRRRRVPCPTLSSESVHRLIDLALVTRRPAGASRPPSAWPSPRFTGV